MKHLMLLLAIAASAIAQTAVVQTTLASGTTAAQNSVAINAASPVQATTPVLTQYAAGATYAVNDLVLVGGDPSTASIYAALSAHTGAASFVLDSPAMNWQLVGAAGQITNWRPGVNYPARRLAIVNGTLISRIAAGRSTATYDGTESQYWSVLGNIWPYAVQVSLLVEAEVMSVPGGSSPTGPLSVVRGALSTTPIAHAAGTPAYIGLASQFGTATPTGACSGTGIQYVNVSALLSFSCVGGTYGSGVSTNPSSGGGATTPATTALYKGNGTANGVVPAVPNIDYLAGTPAAAAAVLPLTTPGIGVTGFGSPNALHGPNNSVPIMDSSGVGVDGTASIYALNGKLHQRDFVSVMDAPYNAVCDGTTDDTAHIQAALDANLPAIKFPANRTCLISGILTMKPSGVSRIDLDLNGVNLKFTSAGGGVCSQNANGLWQIGPNGVLIHVFNGILSATNVGSGCLLNVSQAGAGDDFAHAIIVDGVQFTGTNSTVNLIGMYIYRAGETISIKHNLFQFLKTNIYSDDQFVTVVIENNQFGQPLGTGFSVIIAGDPQAVIVNNNNFEVNGIQVASNAAASSVTYTNNWQGDGCPDVGNSFASNS